ncbi:MAG: branched-chain amino acid ABC transporter permease [Thermoflexales bacterium]|nr:branched-chain amino acid ABC transporter permease [Thermoflexales bacterium]MCS7325273.1 branched-chain amino acid ABC transporter permease [Thermoflexales bacterium]MDW8053558.1 branched-chain amino acid ABC transporter permease [Anaerolineae bacterium]MDW8292146.1 branched-chain amino acid ABC transporter permease [Anaerolineae bacterium]
MLTPTYLAQQLVNALNLGSLYALVAIGLTMVYGILRLINFAHGDMMTLGAYLALGIIALLALPVELALVLPMLLVAGVGLLVERLAYRPLRGAPEVAMLITSLAISSLIQNGATMTLTAQPRPVRLPSQLAQRIAIGELSLAVMDLVIVALALALMVALGVFVKRTTIGIAMRACSENLRAAQLMGVDVNRVIAIAFAISAGLAGVAGVLWSGKFGLVDPFMGFVPGLKAFVAAVIGGIGSIPGAVLGGYLLGFAEVLFVAFAPPGLSGYRDAFVFALLLIVLLVRPAGLLGQREVNRA